MSSQNDPICFCTKHFQYGSPGQRIRLPRFLFEKRDFLQRRGAKTRRCAEISSESFSTFIRHNRSCRIKNNFTYFILMRIHAYSAALCDLATLR